MYRDQWFRIPENIDLKIPIYQRKDIFAELFSVTGFLNGCNSCEYFFSCGTALGVCRDGKLLDWDTDVDIDILEPTDSLIVDIIKEFQLMGYSFYRIVKCEEKYSQIVFVKEPYHAIDFCFWYRENNNFVNDLPETHIFRRTHPVAIYKEFRNVLIENLEFRIPSDVDSYFQLLYGLDWQTPKRYNNWLANANDLKLDYSLSRVFYKFIWRLKRYLVK
jgi:phosphorylcholine metabolism protein LicD